jgi:hypothetical protein
MITTVRASGNPKSRPKMVIVPVRWLRVGADRVDDAELRVEHHLPHEGDGDDGRHVGQQHRGAHQRPAPELGAHGQGGDQPEPDGQGRADHAVQQGVAQPLQEGRRAEDVVEVGQRPLRVEQGTSEPGDP